MHFTSGWGAQHLPSGPEIGKLPLRYLIRCRARSWVFDFVPVHFETWTSYQWLDVWMFLRGTSKHDMKKVVLLGWMSVLCKVNCENGIFATGLWTLMAFDRGKPRKRFFIETDRLWPLCCAGCPLNLQIHLMGLHTVLKGHCTSTLEPMIAGKKNMNQTGFNRRAFHSLRENKEHVTRYNWSCPQLYHTGRWCCKCGKIH